MGKTYDKIDEALAAWIRGQHMFFVATAPRAGELINCSPKGLDTLAILNPMEVAYVDLGGRGAETVAHLRENGRVVIMMCSFEDPPKLLRFYGRGTVVEPADPSFHDLLSRFPPPPMCRAIIRVSLTRIQESCGYGVPLYEFRGQRDTMPRYAAAKTREELQVSVTSRNRTSLEGLPALEARGDIFISAPTRDDRD